MFWINRLNVLTIACVVLGATSNAHAIQWPVNAGPIHQAVPQYLPRYPVQALANPNTDSVPKLKFKRVETNTDAVSNGPIELLSPEPIRTNTNPLPVQQPAATPLSIDRHPASQRLPTEPSRLESPKAELPTVPKAKKPASKKELAKKTSAKKEKKKEKQHLPTVNYDVYRDRNPLPIDPRKPCGICTNPNLAGGCCCGRHCDAPGRHGRPYQEREPGGCKCGDKKCGKCKPMFSLNWPRPFSAKLDEHFPARAAERYSPCQPKRIVDVFDKFIDFKLVDYQRKDNGYCGKGADPYGCLGESRMVASGVAGVGYRFPSVPVDRSASVDFNWR